MSSAATFSADNIDAAFSGVAGKAGLTIWRIEKMKPVPLPEAEYGTFNTGDSYICLQATAKARSSALDYNIHFWLGEETTHDEMGAAAYKTCELDAALGGTAKQHRETQGHESKMFMSLFKSSGGLEYREGGVESGFKKVPEGGKEYRTRLLQVKGRRNVRVSEVELAGKSLNRGDVFILDEGNTIFVFNGEDANRSEKGKGLEVATKLRNSRGATPAIIVVGETADNDKNFWDLLGGEVVDMPEGEEDAAAEAAAIAATALYRVSDASGSLQVDEVPKDGGKLTRSMLDSADVFILDATSQVYVWVGKGCSPEERNKSMMIANDFLATKDRPKWTPLSRVVENAEDAIFCSFFTQWVAPRVVDFTKIPGAGAGIAAAQEQKEIDVASLVKGGDQADEPLVDDGSGTVQMWRIENFAKVEVPADKYGQFFAGDSYIVLYTYKNTRGREDYMLYFWQGRDSTQDEKGASALLATEMDNAMGGQPVQCRVVQGKEPAHFCSIFKGKMIVHAGGTAGGFKNTRAGGEKEDDSYDTDGVALYHVKGTTALNTRAVQVAEVASSLNAGDCFVLLTPGKCYQWNGGGSNEEEQAVAAAVTEVLKEDREVEVVPEGSESDAFWSPLGGKGEYPQEKDLGDATREARLFQCTNQTGVFAVEEVFNFSQDDLIDDDVMLMDTFSQVFLWIGRESNQTERQMAQKVAEDYIKAATDGRDPNTSILTVHAGSEPAIFSCHFLGWDADAAAGFQDPYEARLAAIKKEAASSELHVRRNSLSSVEGSVVSQAKAAAAEEAKAEVAVVDPSGATFPLADLQGGIPAGVDATQKEMYLSDAEFNTVFKMGKADFEKLPKWKRVQAKKSAGLF